MRVGFFGNTNNYPMMLARGMRELGHDVQFVIDQADALYRPENRYPELSPYPPWIHDVSPMRFRHYAIPSSRRSRALSVLRSCDVLILNQYGPSLLPSLDKPAIALMTGSDVVYFGDPRSVKALEGGLLLRATLSRLIARQREGLARSRAVSFFPRGVSPAGDRVLDELGVGDDRRFFIQMTDLDLIARSPLPANPRLRTFCATRLTWKLPMREGTTALDYKGSDIMVRGLGLFVRKHGERLDIHLVRKGFDVDATEALVEAEGLKDMVTWHGEMTQAAVLEEYRKADIVFEQLATSPIGMAGIDAMAVGRPVIGNGRPAGVIEGKAPILQAGTPEQVCAHLEGLADIPSVRESLADEGRRYVEEFHSPARAALKCLERL